MRGSPLSSCALAGVVLIGGLCAFAAPSCADVLELKDGTLVEGVMQARDGAWHVLSRFGVKRIAKDDVAKHLAGPSLDTQLEKALASLKPDDIAGRERLSTWLGGIGRTHEAEGMARDILRTHPESAAAHRVLGHVRYRGKWMSPDAAKRAQGLEQHGDAWFTPEEWRQATPAQRAQALTADQRRRRAARAGEVRRLVDHLLSPSPRLREGARARLRQMAAENKVPAEQIDAALRAADEMIRRVREARTRAVAPLAIPARAGGTRGGWMIADVHDDLVRLKRPIREFATSLASSFAPVKIMLPEVQHIRVRTTSAIPLVPSLHPSR